MSRESTHIIETGDWPEREGRKRVLVENPDGAQLWAYAEMLREAGYDVATCAGEHPDGGDRCPLIKNRAMRPRGGGGCRLLDVLDPAGGDKLLAVLGAQGSTPVVFEATRPGFERFAHLAENATLIATPVTEHTLLDAIAQARSQAAEAEEPPS